MTHRTPGQLKAGKQLALDAATVELVRELGRHGIRAILIKGAAIAARLYGNPVERSYLDIDLLVAPESGAAAEDVLRSLGFADLLADARASERPVHASPWHRRLPTKITVDLHQTIHGCSAGSDAVWRELSRETRHIELGGTSIEVLGDPGQALVIATHATRDGRLDKPLEDLERALTEIDGEAWREAAAMASRLDAAAAFEAGLRRTRTGANLAAELGLAAPASRQMLLRIAGAPPASGGLLAIAEGHDLRERFNLAASRLFPSPARMRLTSGLARQGRLGLILAYLCRPFQVGAHVPAALWAWHAAAPSPPSRRATWSLRRLPLLTAENLSGAVWAWRAGSVVRRQLRVGGLEALSPPVPPGRALSGERGVRAVLARRPMSCLERTAVRQCWHASQGSPRDLVIGVRTDAGFGAHAWLEGDPEGAAAGHQQLLRWPAPNQWDE